MKKNRYEIQEIVRGRYAVWYMELPKDRSKFGVWKIIDLYSNTRNTRFAFRWKVKGKEKTQEQLDSIMLNNVIQNFYKQNTIRNKNKTIKKKPEFNKKAVMV